MMKLTILCAVAILVAASAPAFSKTHAHHRRLHQPQPQVDYGRGFNRDARRNIEDFGFSGIDHSRVGGEDAWLHPGGR